MRRAGVGVRRHGAAGQGRFRLVQQYGSRVGAAIGYKEADGWTTEGWWNLPARKCETVLKGNLVARYYYVYAIDYDHGGEWMGQAFMCTRDKEFTIRGISDCLARGYDRTGFFEVDTGEQHAWTVQLTETERTGPGASVAAGRSVVAAAGRRRRGPPSPSPPRRHGHPPCREADADAAAAADQSGGDARAGLVEPGHDRAPVRGGRRRVPHQYEPHLPRQDAGTGDDHPRGGGRVQPADRHPGRSAGSEAAARQFRERLQPRSPAGRNSCSMPTRRPATQRACNCRIQRFSPPSSRATSS